ncbi:hypothetical protein HELRODRAFT_158733 [Helobdella robusta]|uniref:Uncharacterized protein n=1 Tax=Helobdella robusta TaxID=6412 RepID=T1EN62_HELRO|nr:hypothetical protein HELRODRAFT_158733 [Helobdella robusta]ESO12255.1 hypothetical protein HELRODRAFT_158733 [Helobdella robusta]
MNLKKIESEVAPKRLNFVSLSQNDEIKVKYNVEVLNRCQLLTKDVYKLKYEIFKDALKESAKNVIPVKKTRKEAKEKWLNDKCEIIEKIKNGNTNAMYKNIKEITGNRACAISGCIKAKSGEVILKKEKVLKRWTEFINDLFDDIRGVKPPIKKKRRRTKDA